jgi:hypothetical protein
MRAVPPVLGIVLVTCALACSAGGAKDNAPTELTPDTGHDGSVVDGGFTPDTSGGFDVDPGETSGGDCAEENKQIYIVSQGNDLVRFSPATMTLKTIGTLSCPTGGGFATPFSMAVDRKGTAWVLFNDGHLYKVSTKDASCVATSFVVGQAGFTTFGMGFVADSSGSTTETLYVADYDGKGLGKINTSTLKLTFVGDYGSPLGAGELTGTGTARIFAFFNQTPVVVAELNKSTGKVIKQKPVSPLTVGGGWAFAHWGGDFFLFTAPSLSSQITQYNFDTGTTKTVKTDLGYIVVGAGVSTCAPTAPPK